MGGEIFAKALDLVNEPVWADGCMVLTGW